MFKKLRQLVPLVSAAAASIVEFLFSIDYIQLRVADAVIIGLLALLALDALSERLGLLEQINAKLKNMSEANHHPARLSWKCKRKVRALSLRFVARRNLVHKIHLDSSGKFYYHAFTPTCLDMLH